MLGDRNTFRADPLVRETARMKRRRRYHADIKGGLALDLAAGPDGPAIDSLLAEESTLIDELESARNRLALEIEISPNSESYRGVIDQIEAFVLKVPRLEDKARAGDLAQAKRLVVSTKRIIAAVKSTSPASDFGDNLAATVKDAAADVDVKLVEIRNAAIAVAVAVVVVWIVVTIATRKAGVA